VKTVSQLLSKTKYLNGIQCPKYLWVLSNEPERIPEPDNVTQYVFDQGHVVGELAKMLFPNGIDIPVDNFMGNIRRTEQLLYERIPLFEAGISAGGLYSRIDILNPANGTDWDIIEVKSTTDVKDVHLHDVSFQKYCCERWGIEIRKCFLMHINNKYIKDGDIAPGQFFIQDDITAAVEETIVGIQDRIDTFFEIISAPECPEVTIGRHCSNPYVCPLVACRDFLPEASVFDLYRGGNKCFELLNQGIIAIKDIPGNYRLTAAQQIQRECEATGQAHVNKVGISDFLSTVHYPLNYLDFETFNPAVPMFDGTKPYQIIPFQFSLHTVKDELSRPEHFSFLAGGADDPRPAFLASLKKVLPDTGTVVVYNQGFEESILKELARAYPEYDSWVSQVCSRFVDLLTPFRRFYYYHPVQKGSASIKNVLPAITGRSYQDMEIADGNTASIAFQEVTYGEVEEDEKNRVRANLEKYCALDTEGMMLIMNKLIECIQQLF